MNPAEKVMQRIRALGRISDEPDCLTRTFGSSAMRLANDLVRDWMRGAGMAVRQDPIGNLIGYYPGTNRSSKSFLLGSHLDTVRDAGKFDGPLGVLLAIACVEQLYRESIRLPFGIEVLGFADEEGVRYHTAYLGSRAIAGTLTPADLRRKDAEGISMAEAIRRFGGNPARVKQARFDSRRLLGYLEAHIEQGPVLEQKNLAVGVVSAIAAQTRLSLTFTGKAGHAGTTPMQARQDALCGAAEFILAVEKGARKVPGLVATVGQIHNQPNASNVIPASASLSLDVRHQRNAARNAAVTRLKSLARRVARRRGLKLTIQQIQATPAVPCSPRLSVFLKKAVGRHERPVLALPSGAGHDAVALATLVPVSMLFIRCKGGLSHHPDESVTEHDIRLALSVMLDFLRLLAESPDAA